MNNDQVSEKLPSRSPSSHARPCSRLTGPNKRALRCRSSVRRHRWAIHTTPGVARRQARRTAAGAAAVGAGAVAAGATAAYYAGGGPYAYYGGNGGGGPYGYYSGPGAWSQDYAARNGIICQPGTMVRLEDGLMHRCQ